MYWKIVAILRLRGVSWAEEDFNLQDNSDGKGPFIAYWDEGKLGIRPTKTEIDAAIPTPPPTDADKAEIAMKDNPFMRGWVKRQAAKEGKTPQQIMDEIKAKA